LLDADHHTHIKEADPAASFWMQESASFSFALVALASWRRSAAAGLAIFVWSPGEEVAPEQNLCQLVERTAGQCSQHAASKEEEEEHE
jgi:hypothetical protein